MIPLQIISVEIFDSGEQLPSLTLFDYINFRFFINCTQFFSTPLVIRIKEVTLSATKVVCTYLGLNAQPKIKILICLYYI
jgi:hypothetical protein